MLMLLDKNNAFALSVFVQVVVFVNITGSYVSVSCTDLGRSPQSVLQHQTTQDTRLTTPL